MFPLIWRYLIREFLKLITGTLLSLCAMLVLLRSQEIAQFASLGASSSALLKFTWLLIPHTLPLSIPLATFLSSHLVFHRMSRSKELLALLTSGIRFSVLLLPLVFITILLCLLNGWACSEWSTQSHLMGKKLKYEWSLLNPMHLLQNKTTWSLPKTLVISPKIDNNFQTRQLYLIGESANEWHIFHIDKLDLSQKNLIRGHHATQLSLLPPPSKRYVSLENIELLEFKPDNIPLNQSNALPKLSFDHLTLSQLVSKIAQIKKKLRIKNHKLPKEISPGLAKRIYQTYSKGHKELLEEKSKFSNDLYRRLFFLLSPLSFLLLGTMTGIKIGRNNTRSLPTVFFSFLLLITGYFFGAHHIISVQYNFLLYLFPNLLVMILSSIKIRQRLWEN